MLKEGLSSHCSGDMSDLDSVPDQNKNLNLPLTLSEAQQFDSRNLDPVVHTRICSKHILQTYPERNVCLAEHLLSVTLRDLTFPETYFELQTTL